MEFLLSENRRKVGNTYEAMAASYLQHRGVHILERNYRCRTGEIDLIAKDGVYFVFVEVKFRKQTQSGNSLWAVNREKQRIISKTARHYLTCRIKSMDVPCRFDVIGIDGKDVTWIKNAFDYCS